MVERSRRTSTWIGAFLREVFSMPRRHIIVFLIVTLVFVILEVEFMGGLAPHSYPGGSGRDGLSLLTMGRVAYPTRQL
jgi:hypothetical protein